MSDLQRTPIVDKNGKQTTVYKKPDATSNSRNVPTPQPVSNGNSVTNSSQYPLGLSGDDVDVAMRSLLENLVFTALHTEEDEDGSEGDTVELDSLGYSSDDFTQEAETFAENKMLGFISANSDLVAEALSRDGYDIDSFANDFGYTINGHGTGFWDRETLREGGLGDKLSESARASGGLETYLGDDKKLHLSNS